MFKDNVFYVKMLIKLIILQMNLSTCISVTYPFIHFDHMIQIKKNYIALTTDTRILNNGKITVKTCTNNRTNFILFNL